MNSKKVLTVIGILAIAGAGVLTYTSLSNESQNKTAEQTSQVTPPPANQVATTDWKTYTGTAEPRFTIQYPASWSYTNNYENKTPYTIRLNGPEGHVNIVWGDGFGGGYCEDTDNAGLTIQAYFIQDQELTGCKVSAPNGVQERFLFKQVKPSLSIKIEGSASSATQAAIIDAIIESLQFTDNIPSDWKTYSSTEHEYHIQHPKDWTVSTNKDTTSFRKSGGQDVSLTVQVIAKPMVDAEKVLPIFSVPNRKISKREQLTNNGIAWTRLTVDNNQIVVMAERNNKTYVVQYATFDSQDEKIFKTFMFFGALDGLTRNWKTYTNTKYGYSIKYQGNSFTEIPPSQASNFRIQNYSTEADRANLKPDEYYMEGRVTEAETPCDSSLQKVTNNGMVVFRGPGPVGGDAGGERLLLCANHNGKHYEIMVTVNPDTPADGSTMLDTFTFTK